MILGPVDLIFLKSLQSLQVGALKGPQPGRGLSSPHLELVVTLTASLLETASTIWERGQEVRSFWEEALTCSKLFTVVNPAHSFIQEKLPHLPCLERLTTNHPRSQDDMVLRAAAASFTCVPHMVCPS